MLPGGCFRAADTASSLVAPPVTPRAPALLTSGAVTCGDGFQGYGVSLSGRHGLLEDDEVLTPNRSIGVARARPCSIACQIGRRDVGPLARRRARRGAALRFPRRTRLGAGSAGCARAPVSAGRVAGDRDPGHRGGDAWLCRIRQLGCHGTAGSACPPGDSVPTAEREDVPVGAVATGSGRSGPPPRRVFHRPGRRRDRVARGGGGRQDAAWGAADGRGRRASGVGVRPPRPTGARATRRHREEQRNPLRTKASPIVPERAAAGHDRRHAHPDDDRAADLRHAEIPLPDDRQVQPTQAAGPHSSAALEPGAGHPRRTAATLPRPHRDPHPQGGHRDTGNRISLRAADNSGHPRTCRRHRRAQRRGRLRHLQPAVRTGPAPADRRLATRPLGHRERRALGPRCHPRRGPLDRAHRHCPAGHGQPAQHRAEPAPPPRSRQHRRSLPAHRPQGSGVVDFRCRDLR